MLATYCLNGSLLNLYIYVNYPILYSYDQINIMSVRLSSAKVMSIYMLRGK